MSDTETTALGKRPREAVEDGPMPPPPEDAEDSDEEIGRSTLMVFNLLTPLGPMPVTTSRKKRAGTSSYFILQLINPPVLPHERLYLDHLPDSDRYYKSFMHRESLNFVTVTKWVLHAPLTSLYQTDADGLFTRTSFVISTSVDGHLKFWKKQESGIEFVKHFKTSLKAIVGVSSSDDGKLFATISESGEGRVFDVVNFGMFPGAMWCDHC